mgnify:CR=1 FL=1
MALGSVYLVDFTTYILKLTCLFLAKMVQRCFACPWKLQRDLEELLRYRQHFQAISHCYREANKPADRLANTVVESQMNCVTPRKE